MTSSKVSRCRDDDPVVAREPNQYGKLIDSFAASPATAPRPVAFSSPDGAVIEDPVAMLHESHGSLTDLSAGKVRGADRGRMSGIEDVTRAFQADAGRERSP